MEQTMVQAALELAYKYMKYGELYRQAGQLEEAEAREAAAHEIIQKLKELGYV